LKTLGIKRIWRIKMSNQQIYKHCAECGEKKTSRHDLPLCYDCFMKTKKKIQTAKANKKKPKVKQYGSKEEDEGFSYDFSNPYINGLGATCLIGWIGGIWISWSWWLGIGVTLLYWMGKKETFIYDLVHSKVSKKQSTDKVDKKKDKKFKKESGMETWK
jgi:hypothetical protein